jgi:hypothetical protein
MSGWNESPKQAAKMVECKKIAGCVILVCFNSSSVP